VFAARFPSLTALLPAVTLDSMLTHTRSITMAMPRLHLLTVLLLAFLAAAGLSTGADDQADGKWESLFNGKDLTGWVAMNDGVFTVTNGVLHIQKSSGWLRTEKEFGDFVFEAEWRALETNYNSGFFVRAGLEGKPFPTDVWQVNTKESAVGSFLKGSTTVVPSKTPKMPVNEWVKFRIEARGRNLTLDVNGARVWEFNELEPDHGYIGVQTEGKAFDFRNLRIRELGTN
jgi:hypothetical protein